MTPLQTGLLLLGLKELRERSSDVKGSMFPSLSIEDKYCTSTGQLDVEYTSYDAEDDILGPADVLDSSSEEDDEARAEEKVLKACLESWFYTRKKTGSEETGFRRSLFAGHSFYCVVCCSTDHTVPPDSSVYNISTTKGTEVTVSLQGLTSGQVYYCKAAASSNNTASCAGQVVGWVKGYIIFVASFPSITFPTTSNLASIGTHTIIGITIGISFVVFFCLGVLVTTCIGCMVKTRSKVTLHHPAMKPSAYEMIENSQKTMTAPEVEPNSAYGTTKAIEVEPNSAYGTTKAIEVEPNSAYGTAKKITATEVKPISTYRSAKAIEVEPNSAYGTAKKITATVVEPNLHMK
eukprot:Em0001g2234a